VDPAAALVDVAAVVLPKEKVGSGAGAAQAVAPAVAVVPVADEGAPPNVKVGPEDGVEEAAHVVAEAGAEGVGAGAEPPNVNVEGGKGADDGAPAGAEVVVAVDAAPTACGA